MLKGSIYILFAKSRTLKFEPHHEKTCFMPIRAFVSTTETLKSLYFPKSEISSLWPCSVAVQPGFCWTWSETLKTGFLETNQYIPDFCEISFCLVVCRTDLWNSSAKFLLSFSLELEITTGSVLTSLACLITLVASSDS